MRAEFTRAVASLRAFCAAPQAPQQYRSHNKAMEDRFRHRRVKYEPQASLREPLTTTQQVGWHTRKTHTRAPNDVYVPNHSTDVTIREGWSPVMYYGPLNVLT